VLYESPFRVARLLEELAETLPERRVVLARELTKKFEEWLRGTPAELAAELARRPRKGEFVVVIGPGKAAAPAPAGEDVDADDIMDDADPRDGEPTGSPEAP
jgi:16S rRNA (cytidine1402-2'-O)-methyltransferase